MAPNPIAGVRRIKIPKLPDADALTAELRELLTAIRDEIRSTNVRLDQLIGQAKRGERHDD